MIIKGGMHGCKNVHPLTLVSDVKKTITKYSDTDCN